MTNQLLLSLTNKVLGEGKPTARNNYAYSCPFCNHHKPKLEVNLTENKQGFHPWHCWACDKKGKTVLSLFNQSKTHPDFILELKTIVKYDSGNITEKKREQLKLPDDFVSLKSVTKSDIIGRHALAYLKKRNVTIDDIIRHNIGYCTKGRYKNMVVIPSYNEDGSLNFFVGRSFTESHIKYLNPSISKDFIPFENTINWNLPIIICEGMFDAISIKRNTIPLLGKIFPQPLLKKLASSQVQKVYIALDKDALKQSLKFCEYLLNEGKKVYLVDLDQKDPSEMGFEAFTNLVQKTNSLTFYDLMEKKISLL
jgi:DNA primase